jgi:putative Mg2+ transporter-C (MgtC) family protein
LGVLHSAGAVDATRVLGQVVTGIGFLGAGVMLTRGGHVVGVTTASVIWMLAAIGSSIGFENYSAAITLTLVVLAMMNILEMVENRIASMRKGPHAKNHSADRDLE